MELRKTLIKKNWKIEFNVEKIPIEPSIRYMYLEQTVD